MNLLLTVYAKVKLYLVHNSTIKPILILYPQIKFHSFSTDIVQA
jgi:hypothetical protein